TYCEDGKKTGIAKNSAMDLAIARDILGAAAEAAKLLGNDAAQYEAALVRLPEFQTGSKGQVLEWDREYAETDPHHRHISHLYGFYPGNSFCTEDLVEATRKSMELRGDDATGWSLAWKINVWARLRDGARAHKLIGMMLRMISGAETSMKGGGVYPNLLCAHPPFQIDGNFGFTAGVAEMLLQSHGDTVELLPALPAQWSCGEARGLRARGGYTLDFAWAGGSLTRARIASGVGGICKVRFGAKVAQASSPFRSLPDGTIEFACAPGEPCEFAFED
ncbi:MAG TPA: glycoside hydrolase family 95 protein, partial [Clostridia bacterium]|nr:glycoside hydrolase family 95 protein [Clostridia bacterium]